MQTEIDAAETPLSDHLRNIAELLERDDSILRVDTPNPLGYDTASFGADDVIHAVADALRAYLSRTPGAVERSLLKKLAAIHSDLLAVDGRSKIGLFDSELHGRSDTILDAMIAVDNSERFRSALTKPVGEAPTEALQHGFNLLLIAEALRLRRFDSIIVEVAVEQLKAADAYLTRAQPPSGEMREASALLGELANRPCWELTHGPIDPDWEGGELGWCVTERSGNINDREWTLIGSGETPADAIRAALRTGGDNG